MNATVTAAAIGVSGTVIVGVAGFGAAIWNTRRTMAHDRESRIWDRRAEVYVEALAAVNYRQRRTTAHATEDREYLEAYLARFQKPDWPGLEARLQAIASEPVFTAMQASSVAHTLASSAIQRWVWSESAEGFADALEKKKAAEAADDVVVELIRTEMQGRSRPLGDWTPEPLEVPIQYPEAPGDASSQS